MNKNWIFASGSMNALKVENGERRWILPASPKSEFPKIDFATFIRNQVERKAL